MSEVDLPTGGLQGGVISGANPNAQADTRPAQYDYAANAANRAPYEALAAAAAQAAASIKTFEPLTTASPKRAAKPHGHFFLGLVIGSVITLAGLIGFGAYLLQGVLT